MSKLKRISIIALWVYVVVIPLSLLSSREPELRGTGFAHTDGGIEVTGQVVYSRGGEVHMLGYRSAILSGTADFSISTSQNEYSSTQALNALKSGKAQHGEVSWRIDWIAMVLAYLPIWICVGLIYWFATKPEPVPLEPTNREQGTAQNPVKR